MRNARPPRMFVSGRRGGERGGKTTNGKGLHPVARRLRYILITLLPPPPDNLTYQIPDAPIRLPSKRPADTILCSTSTMSSSRLRLSGYIWLVLLVLLTTALPLNVFSIFLALYFCMSFLRNCLWPSRALDRCLPVLLLNAIPRTSDLF